ncbi:hypothetical protein PybrP1_010441, partial [[Pythium] brassicae (nom. inval.)]
AIGGAGKTPQCSKPAGHAGKCECADGDHTCGEECCLIRAANCGQRCVQLVKHDGMHHCSVPVHRCGMPCMATNCSGACILSIASPHTAHKCEQTTCAEKCSMDGCSHLCGHSDHFHGQTELAVAYSVENPSGKGADVFDAESQTPTIHMCTNAHDCQAMCSEKGNCCVEVFHKESSRTFDGARGKFKYTFQEMNGFRKKCAVVLAPGQQTHAGAHTCVPTAAERRFSVDGAADDDSGDDVRAMDDDVDEDDVMSDEEEKQSAEETTRVLHYCEARCPCCSYFCKKAYGHFGMHATSHGNMRNTYFLADTDDIDIEERKYKAGESGGAEMCNLYCSKMGRGHVHYLECEQQRASACVYVGDTTDQRRHCTRGLEPKPAREMDEVLHEQFWKTLGWEDPCASQDEREQFGKCAFKCDAQEHNEKKSFCVLPAWHKPDLKPAQQDGFSYISGHKFECSHLVDSGKMHHVFALDCSGSMCGQPWDQLMAAYREYMYNRVNEGASLDLVSVVTFDNYGKIEYEAKNITTMLRAHVEFRGGGTSYSAGLRSANEVLSRNSFGTYKPVVVFFSDGQPCDANQGEQLATHVHESYAKYDLKAFVVGYGMVNLSVLQRVAEKLGGTYHSVLVGTELKTTFHTISASLGTHAGLALTKPLHEISCVICQRDMAAEEVAKLQPCGHELHKSCKTQLVTSVRRNGDGGAVTCPICRKNLRAAAVLSTATGELEMDLLLIKFKTPYAVMIVRMLAKTQNVVVGTDVLGKTVATHAQVVQELDQLAAAFEILRNSAEQAERVFRAQTRKVRELQDEMDAMTAKEQEMQVKLEGFWKQDAATHGHERLYKSAVNALHGVSVIDWFKLRSAKLDAVYNSLLEAFAVLLNFTDNAYLSDTPYTPTRDDVMRLLSSSRENVYLGDKEGLIHTYEVKALY